MQPEELGIGKLFERIRDAVIVADAKTQRIVLWNPAAEKMFGYSSSEALELRVEALVPEYLKAQHRAGMVRYAQTGHGPYIDSHRALELPALRKSGEEIHIELSLSPIGPVNDAADGDGGRFVLAIVRDITERKRAEEEVRRLNETLEERAAERTAQLEAIVAELRESEQRLRESEERFRLLVEGVEDYAIFALDPNGYVASWNLGAERIKGYRAEEIIGEHFSRFYTPEDVRQGKPEQGLNISAAKGRFEDEGWRVGKDGSRFWASVLITALRDEAGRLRGFSEVTRDITERKRAEEELRAMAAFPELNPAPIVKLDRERRVVLANPAASEFFSVSDPVGRDWASVCPEAGELHLEALDEEPGTMQQEINRHAKVMLLLYKNIPESDAVHVYGFDITERKRIEEELVESQRQLKDLVGKLVVAQEEERRRIAYEVHDGLTQVAISAHQHLQAFADSHPAGSTVEPGELDRTLKLAQRTVKEARRVIEGLRPTALDDFGLARALRQLLEEFKENEGWEVGYEEALGGERLPPQVETALYRVAQEALTNVSKHARTTKVYVVLRRLGPGKVCLQVRDEGRGFDPQATLEDGEGPGQRVGIVGMRERLSLLGGELKIESAPGRGTSIIAEVPLPAASSQQTGTEYGG